jgi:hypothetical protein
MQHTIHKSNTVIDKNQYKHLLQIKSTAPKFNALIKIHKDNNPIRPVINNIQYKHLPISSPDILTTYLRN